MSLLSLVALALILVLILDLLGTRHGLAAPLGETEDELFDLENYDLTSETEWEKLGINVYGDSYDYEDFDKKVEVGNLSPDIPSSASQRTVQHPNKEETRPPSAVTAGLFGPETGLGMPTCLLCVCIAGSVYCDDMGLDHIPALPRDTSHFYARFNKIRHVKNTDFINLNKLRSIDLTGNQISGMDEDVFHSLPQLQELLLANNKLQLIPELPATMKLIDLRSNRLLSRGVHSEGFKDMSQLEFLYLSNNHLDYIPAPLPLSLRVLHLQNNNIQSLHEDTFCNLHDLSFIRYNLEDIRLDGNPLNINLFAPAYVCLPRLPVGSN